MMLSFIISILEDPSYYNIDKNEIGDRIAPINAWAEAFVLLQDIMLGPVFDTFGRKLIVVVGFFLCGVSIILIPCFNTLFPGYFIARCLIQVVSTMGMNVPLLPDYISKSSMGLAQGITQLVVSGAFLFSSSGLYGIHSLVSDQKYIYFGMGAFVILVSFFLIYSIKDVIQNHHLEDEHDKEETELIRSGDFDSENLQVNHRKESADSIRSDMKNKKVKEEPVRNQTTFEHLKQVVRVAKKELMTKPAYFVCILTCTATKILATCTQFGTYYVQFVYERRGLTQLDAENHVSSLLLKSNLLSMVLVLFVGYLCDKMRPWLVMTVSNIMVIGFSILIILDMDDHDQSELSILYDVGFVGTQCLQVISYMISVTYLAMVCNPMTRGTIFNLNGFFGSTILMLFQLLGGELYSKHSKAWPFYLATGSMGVAIILTLFFAALKKLN